MIHLTYFRDLQYIPWTIQQAHGDKLRCTCQHSRWLRLDRWIETQVSEELSVIRMLYTAKNHLCIANVSYFKPWRNIALHTDMS